MSSSLMDSAPESQTVDLRGSRSTPTSSRCGSAADYSQPRRQLLVEFHREQAVSRRVRMIIPGGDYQPSTVFDLIESRRKVQHLDASFGRRADELGTPG